MRIRINLSIGILLAISLLFVLSIISMAATRQQVSRGYVLAGTLKRVVLIGALPDTTILSLQIGLSLHNSNALDNLVQDIYNPVSPNFRHYLTSKEFTEMFGPTRNDYQSVISFMEAHGLKVTGTYPNRIVVDVLGDVVDIERTFHIKINVYRDLSKARTFYAPEVAATIDSLDVPISDLIGLDNYAPPRPIDLRRPNPGDKVEAAGTGPGGLFIGKDYRAAYAPGVTLDGTGQTVGLFEFGPYWTNDITTYEDQAGMPHAKISNVLLDGFSGIPDSGEDVGEESLDIENAIAMAPGASFVVYEGSSAVDILSQIASDNSAKQISCSFGWYPPSLTEEKLYVELVAQGQSFFVASGDGGAYADTVEIFSPTDNPDIVCVGGTSLSTARPGGPWSSEISWNGSGGGISQTFGAPSWQAGISNQKNQGSSSYRNFPDVAATAAFQFYFVYNNGKMGGIGGTSGAAPLWAGFMALVNQQAAINEKPGAGYINPALYSIGKGNTFNYDPDFHDIMTGNNFNNKSPDKFSSVSGYDLVTGWGTPNGIYTINALAGITTPDFSLSVPQQTLRVNQGTKDTFAVLIKPLNGFNSVVNLSASSLPVGVSISFAPSSSPDSILLILAANDSGTTGTSATMIVGTSDSLSHSIPVELTVNSAATATMEVDLSHYFNRTGVVADGSTFSGGLDGVGYAYSENLLGTSINWNNTPFILGRTGGNNAVSSTGQTITLPTGNFAELRILGTAVEGSQAKQKFTINYSGSTSIVMQSFSDWYLPSNYSGETTAFAMSYRDAGDGTMDNRTFYLYGYLFKLDPSKIINSITLPSNQNVEILAMTLAAPLVSSVKNSRSSAGTFELSQNYPNPFNPSTIIQYNLPSNSFVALKVYDVLGREMRTLVNKYQPAGTYSVIFNGTNLTGGVYFYRLQAGSFTSTRKLVLIK